MQNTTRRICLVSCIALVLAVILTFSSVLFQAHAQARIANSQNSSTHLLQRAAGKVIVVSLSRQWLYAYSNGHRVFSTAVLTGRPSLPTPKGTYHVFAKLSPTTFHSPFPKGSPNWYPPTHIKYALEFRVGGYYLHDSWWHSAYGPGTNSWHNDPEYGWQSGSHGCVSMPVEAAAWLYRWAPIGTEVRIVA